MTTPTREEGKAGQGMDLFPEGVDRSYTQIMAGIVGGGACVIEHFHGLDPYDAVKQLHAYPALLSEVDSLREELAKGKQMREIKFRAWSPQRRMMFSWNALATTGMITLSGSNRLADGTIEEIIPMQFTGLLDKNGKEIYEGDIVSHSEWVAGSPQEKKYPKKNGVVVWDPKQGWVFESRPLWSIAIYDTNEVIGNIHESPNLIPGAK